MARRSCSVVAMAMMFAFGSGCSGDETSGAASGGTGASSATDGDAGGAGGSAGSGGSGGERVPPETGPPWEPSTKLGSDALPQVRGLLDVRGLIHEHSVHSHDACDDAPRDASGNIDAQCFQDFHDGMCQSRHDFVMLTDHGTFFSETEYPETLLHRPDRGDELIVHDGAPTANRVSCGEGSYLVLAGNEGGTMPVGLERHVADVGQRDGIYGGNTADATAALREAGAVVLLAHPEEVTADELSALPIDGFEMFNLHANMLADLTRALELAPLLSQPDQLMHPDLAIMGLITEDPAYLERWGTVLARGHRRVTTLGTDAHRNTLDVPMPDGERVDSYRRLNVWFSNHLLVEPGPDGSWDDRALKEALGAGRLYGVFEFLGYAADFSYVARAGTDTHEMGSEVPLSAGPELVVTLPRVRLLDPAVEPPELTARVLRAVEGGWEVVDEGSGDRTVPISTPGAYRAEIRMRPRHLRGHLNSFADLADEDFVWIYSNAIYVTE